ncbi:MAG: SIS domain-containing protein [Candidatus Viridilinea halotolerans]|uniref:SIS domain-containing protein n=1 Tax=Candidatus Viridilinea halotolerans TaxID=2491704 RepID=A0A426UA37_9CHLR|nr:MAG: SIS domain-containing protein [Candidatus Viridilinea halotolerans]
MNQLNAYLQKVALVLQQVPQAPLNAIADALWATYERDGSIIVCGNGGSAATASHFASDLLKWTIHPGARRVRAFALTDNIPVITAFANDQHYSEIFVEQMMTFYRPGDLLFAISGSGNSPNVVQAVTWANRQGATTVGITGFDGGQLAQLATVPLHVAHHHMPQVEDIHSTMCHALAVELGERIKQTVQPVKVNGISAGAAQ